MLNEEVNLTNDISTKDKSTKELQCLFEIENILSSFDKDISIVFEEILSILPLGFMYPEINKLRILYNENEFCERGFIQTNSLIYSDIKIQNQLFGRIEVHYSQGINQHILEYVKKEENKLIKTVAQRLASYLLHQKLKNELVQWKEKNIIKEKSIKKEWEVVQELLKKTDPPLFAIISRKMLNHLFTKGVPESQGFFKRLGTHSDDDATITEINRPSKRQVLDFSLQFGDQIFKIAEKYLPSDDILTRIQRWINEEKSHYLVKSLANQSTPLAEIADALRRYYHTNTNDDEKNSPVSKGIRVSLIRRFMTDQLEFIKIGKDYIFVKDFYDILQNMVFPSESHGKIGGKSAGVLLAKKVIEHSKAQNELLVNIDTPKTWFITSDAVLHFLYHNNLEDVIEQKYKDIDEIRKEYPHIIQAFKNSQFPGELTNGLSRALDDFGESPIIVRSSSLLEDRMGAAFAGKYKSLFLANQGTKEERLDALMDAIAEVYASTFGPDPIGYRIERGLLDFNEEMGIMIQEVVGKKLGKYFFPAFAGVAFSHNEFRWSPRIKREDGLIRMVAGLGTRAVDRIGDDYPILIAPSQPQLRVNLSFDDIVNYSPKSIDVINIETNTFETVPISVILDEVGIEFPMLNDIFSILEENHLRKPVGIGIDPKNDDLVVTFDNMINNTNYVKQIDIILKLLKEKFNFPIDVEFACDGEKLYLLQCRPQSSSYDNYSSVIPKDVPKERVLFTANKYISNGRMPDLNYIVYVVPESYSEITNLADLKEIGRIVGKLNKILPKKSFILLGPGRWGSRGDIRLGVSVTYADINNTAMLVEIARKKGNYVPDLSFGTHFFQDLVEAQIRYLPLYPDDDDIIFNDKFFHECENILARLLPECASFGNTIKVINVNESTKGMKLRILMNADKDEAMGIFIDASLGSGNLTGLSTKNGFRYEEPWEWRLKVAERIASYLNPHRFGVKGMYVFGTTFNKTATQNSDLDILVYFDGNQQQLKELNIWFEAWSFSLLEINFLRTGYRVDKFLDVKYVTKQDLEDKLYYTELTDPKKNLAKSLILGAGKIINQ